VGEVTNLSERDEREDPDEADGEEVAGHPADAGLFPSHVALDVRPRRLVGLLAEPKQIGPKPTWELNREKSKNASKSKGLHLTSKVGDAWS
jgi:hypothetical protein